MNKKKLILILEIIGIIAFVIFAIFIIKMIIDLSIYNKCFVQPYDSNFDYNMCTNYLDY